MSGAWFCLVCALALLFLALGIVCWQRRRLRATMTRLDRMIEAAMAGTFKDAHFDESLCAALEAKMAHYLSGSEAAKGHLREEKEKVKALVGDISHQTKTPIANLLLYSQLLQEERDLPEAAQRYAAELTTQAEKLRFLIDALVKTSRLETGLLNVHPQPSALAPLIRAAVDLVRPAAAQKGQRLTYEDTDLSARFDPKWTVEALYNLLDNAVKYTPDGGEIAVTVEAYAFFTAITVRDSGIGVAPDEQAKLFQRFYRAPEAFQTPGVGLGLYLSQQIAAAEGGYLTVQSTPGQGAAFSLFLPSER